MSLWTIAWRNVTQRGLASTLTAFSMALGVLLVTIVLAVHGLVSNSFLDNSSLGYNLIAGAKGGKLQLVLNTTFYLSEPVENIPYSFYQEFLSAEKQANELALMDSAERGELTDGYYSKDTQIAIPVCLGDYFNRFRVVGTLPKFFEELKLDFDTEESYRFAQGRNFQIWNEENGYFEAVVGSIVANELGLKLGDPIVASHGSSEPDADVHDDSPFVIVGILESTGTPNDRAVFVNMEGFYLMDSHAKPVEGEQLKMEQVSSKLKKKPLPLKNREVTAILIRTKEAFSQIRIKNEVNEGNLAQVVQPILEIYTLFEIFVKPIQLVLLVMTILICIVSGISILVSIYNSMNERKHDIAVMRALGASRKVVMGIVLLESVILSLGGGLIGWLGGHAVMSLASPIIEARTGVSISFFDMAPSPKALEAFLPSGIMVSSELLLIPGLILLAIVVGFVPAYTAYRTDVASALHNS